MKIRKNKDLQQIYAENRSLLADEAAFIEFCKNVSNLMDEKILGASFSVNTVSPRERIRDLLRKEAFVQAFQDGLQSSQSMNLSDMARCMSKTGNKQLSAVD